GLDLLGDVDLLGAAGLVGGGGVLAAAEGPPGLTRELQAAVVAVAGVDRPVAAGLALRDAVPDGTRRGGRCRGAAVLRGGRVLGAALGAAVGRARAGALLGLLLALLLGLGRLGRGLGSGLRLLLGALGDDLGDRLGDDVLGDDLGLGDLAVDNGLGVDELLGAGLALGGGLGGALVQGVVLDGLRLERDLLGLGALVLAHALDLMGGAVLEHGIARDVGGVGVLDVAEHLLHRVAHGQRGDLEGVLAVLAHEGDRLAGDDLDLALGVAEAGLRLGGDRGALGLVLGVLERVGHGVTGGEQLLLHAVHAHGDGGALDDLDVHAVGDGLV